jgi:hypothetical protein
MNVYNVYMCICVYVYVGQGPRCGGPTSQGSDLGVGGRPVLVRGLDGAALVFIHILPVRNLVVGGHPVVTRVLVVGGQLIQSGTLWGVTLWWSVYLHVCVCVCVYTYIHIYIYICYTYTLKYIHTHGMGGSFSTDEST